MLPAVALAEAIVGTASPCTPLTGALPPRRSCSLFTRAGLPRRCRVLLLGDSLTPVAAIATATAAGRGDLGGPFLSFFFLLPPFPELAGLLRPDFLPEPFTLPRREPFCPAG